MPPGRGSPAPGGAAAEGPGAGKTGRGRPQKAAGENPMPKSIKGIERAAACAAHYEASEDKHVGANPDVLEHATKEKYPAQLDVLIAEGHEFPTSSHRVKGQRNMYIYNAEESKVRRPMKTNLHALWLETRKTAVNEILTVYLKKLNKDGEVPSGTNGRDQFIRELKGEVAAATGVVDLEQGEDGGGEDAEGIPEGGGLAGGGIGGGRLVAEHPCWLAWLINGPLGNKLPDWVAPPPPGTKQDATRKPPSREELRGHAREEANNKGAVGSEAEKVEQLKKLVHQGKKRARREKKLVKAAREEAEEKKHAAQLERMEKLMERLGKKLKKQRNPELQAELDALEDEYDAVLKRGPLAVESEAESDDSAPAGPSGAVPEADAETGRDEQEVEPEPEEVVEGEEGEEDAV